MGILTAAYPKSEVNFIWHNLKHMACARTQHYGNKLKKEKEVVLLASHAVVFRGVVFHLPTQMPAYLKLTFLSRSLTNQILPTLFWKKI